MQDECQGLTEQLTKVEHDEILQFAALGYDRFRALHHDRMIPSKNELFSCQFLYGNNRTLLDEDRKKYTVEFIGEHAQLGPVARVYVNNGEMITIWEMKFVGLPIDLLNSEKFDVNYSNPVCIGINLI